MTDEEIRLQILALVIQAHNVSVQAGLPIDIAETAKKMLDFVNKTEEAS